MSKAFSAMNMKELVWHNERPYTKDHLPYVFGERSVEEAELRFMKGNNLDDRWQSLKNQSAFVIADTQFGAGLELMLSWTHWMQHAPEQATLHYISCDNQPVHPDDLKRILASWPHFKDKAEWLLKEYPVLTPGYHRLVFEGGRISLTLMLGNTALSFRELLHCGDATLEPPLRTCFVDAWFLKNTLCEDLSHSVSLLSKASATFAGTSHNPPILTGKNNKVRITPWHASVPRNITSRKSIIIGAGLAGCFMAHSLARRGWDVVLADAGQGVATGASANRQAVLYPKLSAFSSPLTTFMLTAYLDAVRCYSKLLENNDIGELSGLLQLAYNQRETISQQSLQAMLDCYPVLGKCVDAREASVLAGMSLPHGGLYLPLSGWLDSQALCHLLIQHPRIRLLTNYPVSEPVYEQEQWWIGEEYTSHTVVIANGYRANQFQQTLHLPLIPVSGVMTGIATNEKTQALKIPLCGEGHVLPAREGIHWLGATYHQNKTAIRDVPSDEQENLEKLARFMGNNLFGEKVVENWSATRGATPDYLPLVGPVPDDKAFCQRFEPLSTDSRRWLAAPGNYYPGLYICAGFGSRGLTTIPVSAEWLAALINQEPSPLPRHLERALSPARFLMKKITRK